MASTSLDKPAFSVSNFALTVLMFALMAAILLDGILYNRQPQALNIYSIEDAQNVELHYADQLIMQFSKEEENWQQLIPVKAPASADRIQILLDSNQHAQRQYQTTELPIDEIFKDPVVLKINNNTFQFGALEPVSNLRYVLANDQVYLQPDTVAPLLNSANNVFIDLRITGTVEQVMIDGETTSPAAWSNLRAIDVYDQLPSPNSHQNGDYQTIQLVEQGKPKTYRASSHELGFIISATDNSTHYLITKDTAESLGLIQE